MPIASWLGIILTIIAVILIPFQVFMFRAATRWTRVEDTLEEVCKDLKEIVEDKNRAHTELAATIRDDRQATDKRLRWLEEHLWNSKTLCGIMD